MQVQYQLFFRIDLRHDYFHDGKCRQIRLVPSETSAQLMQLHGLRLVERDGFYEVFFRSDQAVNPFLSEHTEDFILSFRLLVTDHLFYNYTDLEPTDFSQNGWLSDWAVKSDSFDIYRLSEVLVPKISPSSEEINDELSVIFLEDGVTASDFGLLSILFPLAGGVSEDWIKSANIPSVTLNFNTRRTTWRYYIIPPAEDYNLNSVRIDGEATFNLLAAKQQLPDGTEAIVLESGNPLALRDRYPHNPVLKIDRRNNGEEVPIEVQLPNPSADRISGKLPNETPTTTDGYYSDLYVYL